MEKVAANDTNTATISEENSTTCNKSKLEAMDVQAGGECAKIVGEQDKQMASDPHDSCPLNGRTPTSEEGSPLQNGKTNGVDEKTPANGNSSENGNGVEAGDGQGASKDDEIKSTEHCKNGETGEVEPATNENTSAGQQQPTAAAEDNKKQQQDESEGDHKKQSSNPDNDNNKGKGNAEGSGCEFGGIADSGKADAVETCEAKLAECVSAKEPESPAKSSANAETDVKSESKSTNEGGVNATNATVEECKVTNSSDKAENSEHLQNGKEAIVNGSSGAAIGGAGVVKCGNDDDDMRTSVEDNNDSKSTEESEKTNEKKDSDNKGSNEKVAAENGENIVEDKAKVGGDSIEAIDSTDEVTKNKLIPQISITEAEPMEVEQDEKTESDEKSDSKTDAEQVKATESESKTATHDSEKSESKIVEIGSESTQDETSSKAKPEPSSAESEA